jgi:hypothetical protein
MVEQGCRGMTPLGRRYTAEVDAVTPSAWSDQITRFRDANLYQFWNDGASNRVSHLLLKREGALVACAQARVFGFPLVPGGIVHLLWGPLWRSVSSVPEAEVFEHMLRALSEEYVARRRMVLRINPRLYLEQDSACVMALREQGFAPVEQQRTKRSLIADLRPDLDELRRTFEKKWRNSLSKAERSGLEIASGTTLGLFDEFVAVYERLLERKQFAPTADIDRHRRVQGHVPDRLKMRIVIARHEGRACAGAIYSALGDTAVYLFGATDEAGMRSSASYLVQWTIIQELKALGIPNYDLNGIDPELNPGVYGFKKGLAGKYGREVTFIGPLQKVRHPLQNYPFLFAARLRQRVRRQQPAQPPPTA